MDALIDRSDPASPTEAGWPAAEFIVGNPPFLGGKLLRRELGDDYVDDLFAAYNGLVPREADLVAYWHEKARAEISAGRSRRAGLLATQGIRGGANRRVLDRICDTGGIFFARSDEPWVLKGANVHISFIGQDVRSTHVPMSPIRPDSSASGMNRSGARRPRVGWSHRISAFGPNAVLIIAAPRPLDAR